MTGLVDMRGMKTAAATAALVFLIGPPAAADPAPTALADVAPASQDTPACSGQWPEIWSPALPDDGPLTGEALVAAVEQAFNARIAWGVAANAAGDGGVLSVAYPDGSINPGNDAAPEGGAGFYGRLPQPVDRACLHYEVRFPDDMAFVKGGKLPGLFGGEAPSGGDDADGRNGFSIRLMWREDGTGEVYAYVVNDGDADYGLSVGRGAFAFDRGEWTDIDLEVALNRPDDEDGAVRLWIDGRPVIEQTGVVFRTVPDVGIDGLMFSTFFGGGSPDWASPKDQTVEFRAFSVHGPAAGTARGAVDSAADD